MVTHINIGGRRIGAGEPCFVIAEAGVNHNGDLAKALELIEVAAECRADAIKFQTFRADKLVTESADKADYQKQTTDASESQFDMLRRLELSESDHRTLIAHCQTRNVTFLSTPFEEDSAQLLNDLDVPAFKIPSGEMTNAPLLNTIAGFGRPMVVSTGMCSLAEVEQAVGVIEAAGNNQFVLLQCVSNYPADPADVNLRAMVGMHSAFGMPVGYSDHTLGTAVAVAAVAMGACVIEKHFTLDRNLPGPDHQASLEPTELKQLINDIRTAESAFGDGRKQATASEASTAAVARKSLVAAIDVPAGTELTEEFIAIKRPGTGLPPAMRPHFLHRKTRTNIARGTLLTMDMLE